MTTKKISQMSMFLALMIASGLFSIPLPIGLPIVLQNMAAMLTGAILGKKQGLAVVGVFLFLIALGFPFLPGGRGGAAIFFSPSGGFLLAYMFSAFFIGLFVERDRQKNLLSLFLIFFFWGTLFINFCGSFSLWYFGKSSYIDSVKMVLVFIPLDTLKALISAMVSQKVLAYKKWR